MIVGFVAGYFSVLASELRGEEYAVEGVGMLLDSALWLGSASAALATVSAVVVSGISRSQSNP